MKISFIAPTQKFMIEIEIIIVEAVTFIRPGCFIKKDIIFLIEIRVFVIFNNGIERIVYSERCKH